MSETTRFRHLLGALLRTQALRLLLAATLICVSTSASAQTQILKNVGIDQRLGESIPLDVSLRDEAGRDVRLRDLLHGRPVLLTFVYFECPMLCTTTLNQLTRGLTAMRESAGNDFDVVTVSFDPRETPELASAKKQTYLRAYRRRGAEDGWRFVTGPQESIDRLTRAAGFQYAWDEPNKVFAHAAAVIVLTPQGRISRYFLGIDYPPTELSAALKAARGGDVGKPVEQIYLYCFHYDPSTGKYGLIIDRAIHVLGLCTVLGLGGLIGVNLVRERRRYRAQEGVRT